MKTIVFVAALACIAGCEKKPSSDQQRGGGAASADACTAAIDQAIDAMIASRQQAIDTRAAAGEPAPAGMMQQMTEVSNKLRTVMTARCKADGWPAPVIECFSRATDQPGIKQCREQLPPEAGQQLQLEIVKIMSAGRPGGGPGGMPHGAGPAGGGPAGGGSAGGGPAGSGPAGSGPAGGGPAGSGPAGGGSAAPAGEGAAPAGAGSPATP